MSIVPALVTALVLLTTATAHAQILSISDVSQLETNGGTTSFTFTVTLDAPAGPGGATFDIATANASASSPADFVAASLTGQTIPSGSTLYTFNVIVNGDVILEADETFFVNVTGIVGAAAGDALGVGTILNDDLTPIHDIQGPGAASPIVGSVVTTRGLVTGVTPNGFFLQEEDANVDADPATSEGIFVFTSSAPPAAAALTARVEVTGTVSEVVPSAGPATRRTRGRPHPAIRRSVRCARSHPGRITAIAPSPKSQLMLWSRSVGDAAVSASSADVRPCDRSLGRLASSRGSSLRHRADRVRPQPRHRGAHALS